MVQSPTYEALLVVLEIALTAMRRSLLCLSTLVALCSSVHAADADERVVRTLSRNSGVSEQDVRDSYSACDSGVTRSMTICAMYGYKVEDLRLNDLYPVVLKNVKGTSAEKKLAKAQRAWLAFRNAACDYESDGWSGGTGHAMVEMSCMANLTRDRIKQLEEYAQCKQPSCPGEW